MFFKPICLFQNSPFIGKVIFRLCMLRSIISIVFIKMFYKLFQTYVFSQIRWACGPLFAFCFFAIVPLVETGLVRKAGIVFQYRYSWLKNFVNQMFGPRIEQLVFWQSSFQSDPGLVATPMLQHVLGNWRHPWFVYYTFFRGMHKAAVECAHVVRNTMHVV